jgi:hypothetical protein
MGILTYDDRMDGKVSALEVKVVGTLDTFQKQYQKDTLQQRYIMLTDQLMQLKLMIYKYPKDKSLQDDWQRIYQERESIRQQMDKRI